MNKYLSPSILAADFTILGKQVGEVEAAGSQFIHLDMMDGLFVPSISFGMPVIESLRPASNMVFDAHMMVVDPERYIEQVRKAGADIISVHVEACKDPKAVLLAIKELGAKPGLAFNPETPVSELVPFLPYVYEVVLMSVHPGFGGQAFIPESHDKIRELKALREEMGLDFLIEVDGGVKLDNVESVLESGADVIVAGSAVFGENIPGKVKGFLDILKKYED